MSFSITHSYYSQKNSQFFGSRKDNDFSAILPMMNVSSNKKLKEKAREKNLTIIVDKSLNGANNSSSSHVSAPSSRNRLPSIHSTNTANQKKYKIQTASDDLKIKSLKEKQETVSDAAPFINPQPVPEFEQEDPFDREDSIEENSNLDRLTFLREPLPRRKMIKHYSNYS